MTRPKLLLAVCLLLPTPSIAKPVKPLNPYLVTVVVVDPSRRPIAGALVWWRARPSLLAATTVSGIAVLELPRLKGQVCSEDTCVPLSSQVVLIVVPAPAQETERGR